MGVSGISIWQLLIILVIVLLLFGTKRLKNIGADLGNAIKGFRGAMSEREAAENDADSRPGNPAAPPPRVADNLAARAEAPRPTASQGSGPGSAQGSSQGQDRPSI